MPDLWSWLLENFFSGPWEDTISSLWEGLSNWFYKGSNTGGPFVTHLPSSQNQLEAVTAHWWIPAFFRDQCAWWWGLEPASRRCHIAMQKLSNWHFMSCSGSQVVFSPRRSQNQLLQSGNTDPVYFPLLFYLLCFVVVPLLNFTPSSIALGSLSLFSVQAFLRTIFCLSCFKIALCNIWLLGRNLGFFQPFEKELGVLSHCEGLG